MWHKKFKLKSTFVEFPKIRTGGSLTENVGGLRPTDNSLQVEGLRLEEKMNQYIFPFEKLDVWQMSVDLAERVLDLLEQLPQNRHQRLIGQMEAAATSPAQNIGEGEGRQYKHMLYCYLKPQAKRSSNLKHIVFLPSTLSAADL
jgi:hypothetical protein